MTLKNIAWSQGQWSTPPHSAVTVEGQLVVEAVAAHSGVSTT